MSNLDIIGGEFEIFPQLKIGGVLNGGIAETDDRKYYASGRTCLYAILKSLAILFGKNKRVLVPDYICASVTRTIIDSGYDFSFYQVERNFYPNMESLYNGLQRQKIVLLVNYFGGVDLNDTISLIRKFSEDVIIIVDNVQDYYGLERTKECDYAFTSFRKWFPVPDGAEVIVRNRKQYIKMPEFMGDNRYARYKFAGNILKYFRDDISDSVYLKLLEKGERILNEEYLCECTDYSLAVMQRMNTEEYAKTRKNNAMILHDGLKRLGITHTYNKDTVPLFVPIMLESRERIREKLFEQHIFCPIHWPHESAELQGNNILYTTELSLICDQRYDEKDMKRILEILESECKNM